MRVGIIYTNGAIVVLPIVAFFALPFNEVETIIANIAVGDESSNERALLAPLWTE